jgi:hypothetical protein
MMTAENMLPNLVDTMEHLLCAQLGGVWERKDDEDFILGEKTMSPRIMRLRDQMSRCILEKLGIEEAFDDGGLEEFEPTPIMQIMAEGHSLQSAEDIIACWYVLDGFPLCLDLAQMACIKEKLQEQQEMLEAEKASYKKQGELHLWRFRRMIKADQLEQIESRMSGDAAE